MSRRPAAVLDLILHELLLRLMKKHFAQGVGWEPARASFEPARQTAEAHRAAAAAAAALAAPAPASPVLALVASEEAEEADDFGGFGGGSPGSPGYAARPPASLEDHVQRLERACARLRAEAPHGVALHTLAMLANQAEEAVARLRPAGESLALLLGPVGPLAAPPDARLDDGVGRVKCRDEPASRRGVFSGPSRFATAGIEKRVPARQAKRKRAGGGARGEEAKATLALIRRWAEKSRRKRRHVDKEAAAEVPRRDDD
jgi:hypothetical protein